MKTINELINIAEFFQNKILTHISFVDAQENDIQGIKTNIDMK